MSNVIHVDFVSKTRIQKDQSQQNQAVQSQPNSVSANKRRVFEDLLEKGMVAVVLDATMQGVCVPEKHKHDPALMLNFSNRFGIHDFRHDAFGVYCTLSYGGVQFYTIVPWDAVAAIASHTTHEAVYWDKQ